MAYTPVPVHEAGQLESSTRSSASGRSTASSAAPSLGDSPQEVTPTTCEWHQHSPLSDACSSSTHPACDKTHQLYTHDPENVSVISRPAACTRSTQESRRSVHCNTCSAQQLLQQDELQRW